VDAHYSEATDHGEFAQTPLVARCDATGAAPGMRADPFTRAARDDQICN
jgi:hypothetical protein